MVSTRFGAWLILDFVSDAKLSRMPRQFRPSRVVLALVSCLLGVSMTRIRKNVLLDCRFGRGPSHETFLASIAAGYSDQHLDLYGGDAADGTPVGGE